MLFGCLLLVTNACQKDELKYDTPTEKPILKYSKTAAETSLDFFDPYFAASQNSNVNPSTADDDQTVLNPLLQEIIHELSTKNDANEFVTKTIKMIGYPIWNKSSLYKTFANAPNVSLGFTPFVFLDEDKTNSILMTLKVGNDFHFNVISREYADFITNPETISQFSLDTDFVDSMEAKKGMYCSYDGKMFDTVETLDNPFAEIQIENLESEDSGGTPQYTMTIIIWIIDPYGSCNMFGGGGGGGTLTGHAINIHTGPTVGGPGGTTGNPDTGSGGSSGGGGSFNPNEDDGFDEDFEDEAEFDPNFNDALNGFEDRVINKALAALGVFNGEFSGEEQQMILGFIEYLDSTNPAFIPNPEEAFHEYLLATNAEYAEFSAAFATMPPWMLAIIKEMLLDAILDIVGDKIGDLLPVDVNAFKDAARGLSHNDPIEFLLAAVDILDNYFPIVNAADAVIKSVMKAVKISSVWKVLSKMQEFGQDFVENMVEVLKNTVGKDWYEKIKWKNNDGAIVSGSGDGADFFEKLIEKLGFNMNDVKSNSPIPGIDELILKDDPNATPPFSFLINGLPAEIKYYLEPAGSGSSSCPTIAIKIGSYTFKMRFC